MSNAVPFTDNYSDLSNDNGFQFEFFCERCGNGYRSGFQPSVLGIGSTVARGLGGLLGGAFGSASQAADELSNATNSAAKDRALGDAVKEMRPRFTQCHSCGAWVCKDICWNDEINLCVNCAPKLGQELGKLQAEAQLQQVGEKVANTDYTEGVNVERMQVALCPHCHAEAQPGAKFCGDCGKPMSADLTCGTCGTVSTAGTKFCPECGKQL